MVQIIIIFMCTEIIIIGASVSKPHTSVFNVYFCRFAARCIVLWSWSHRGGRNCFHALLDWKLCHSTSQLLTYLNQMRVITLFSLHNNSTYTCSTPSFYLRVTALGDLELVLQTRERPKKDFDYNFVYHDRCADLHFYLSATQTVAVFNRPAGIQ